MPPSVLLSRSTKSFMLLPFTRISACLTQRHGILNLRIRGPYFPQLLTALRSLRMVTLLARFVHVMALAAIKVLQILLVPAARTYLPTLLVRETFWAAIWFEAVIPSRVYASRAAMTVSIETLARRISAVMAEISRTVLGMHCVFRVMSNGIQRFDFV